MFEELKQLGIAADIDLILRIGTLILARFIAAGTAIPFMGGQLIPGRLKFGIPLVFTVFLYPILAPSVPVSQVPPMGILMVLLLVKEMIVGYTLGFIVSLPFYAVETAGSFMDTQRGTTQAQVSAPLLGGMTSLLSQLYLLLFISIFLGIGGNHLVIEAIAQSYTIIPITEWPKVMNAESPMVNEVIRLTGDVMLIGLTMSAPVVVAMLVTDVTLGVVNRTAPNVQVFWLGMPIKTLLGLVIVFFAIGYAAETFSDLTVSTVAAVKRAVRLMAGASG